MSAQILMDKIRKQSGRDFLYNANMIDENKHIELIVKDKLWTVALEDLWRSQGLSFEIRTNNVLIFPNKSNSSQEVSRNLTQRSISGRVVLQVATVKTPYQLLTGEKCK